MWGSGKGRLDSQLRADGLMDIFMMGAEDRLDFE